MQQYTPKGSTVFSMHPLTPSPTKGLASFLYIENDRRITPPEGGGQPCSLEYHWPRRENI